MRVVGDVSQSELSKMLTPHIFMRFFVFQITLLCKFTQIKRTQIGSKFIRLAISQPFIKSIIIFSRVPQLSFKHEKSLYVKT